MKAHQSQRKEGKSDADVSSAAEQITDHRSDGESPQTGGTNFTASAPENRRRKQSWRRTKEWRGEERGKGRESSPERSLQQQPGRRRRLPEEERGKRLLTQLAAPLSVGHHHGGQDHAAQ